MNTAIVGAGIAGLACARRLAEAGAAARVYDTARGPGGRLATRRLDCGRADLGAQYFTARDPEFVTAVQGWENEGIVARWDPVLVRLEGGVASPVDAGDPRWVGVPRMSALTRHLAAGVDMVPQYPVTGLTERADGWHVTAADGRADGPYAAIVLALPAPRAAPLLRTSAPALAERADGVAMRPCWAAALDASTFVPAFDAAFVHDHALRWVARDGSKPQRDRPTIWVAHATPGWSAQWLEHGPEEVLERLVELFRDATGMRADLRGLFAQRWRYSQAPEPLADRFLLDRERGVGACGDWCSGNRIEGAWLSGHALGAALLGG